MPEHIGRVLNTFENNTAEVMTDRKDACSGCADTHKCRTCLTSAHIVATVQNLIGASQGDVVSIYLEDSALWTGAVLLYIIPVLWLLVGAFVGNGLGGAWRIGETGGAILLGLSGLIIGLLITTFISRSTRYGKRIMPRIVRVIEHREGEAMTGHPDMVGSR